MTYIGDKENRSTYKILAQMQPSVADTAESIYSPGADEEVHIKVITIVNLNNQDITAKIYLDNDGTTYDATTIIASPTVIKEDSKPSVFEGSSIFMNNENGNLAVEASDVDVTITVWGVVYDLS